jgi:hypothetical protein
MSDVVEKQDVRIDKIFQWGRVFEVIDPTREDESVALVYMKLLGDADLGRARVYALRKSSELRRKLKDENSDERIAWVRSIDEVTEEDLINLIILFAGRDIANEAKNKVRIPTPKPPKSNAKLEKQEAFQKEVDEYPEKKSKAISDAINKEIEKRKESLSSKPKEDLYRDYVRLLVDEFCEREAIQAFEDMQTYLGCYTDDTYKTLFFRDSETNEPSFEVFSNLEPTVKNMFKDAYKSLDIEISELKKLRRATP